MGGVIRIYSTGLSVFLSEESSNLFRFDQNIYGAAVFLTCFLTHTEIYKPAAQNWNSKQTIAKSSHKLEL